ncbi:MAG: hypothetical protein H7293_02615 [Candidatus Saccharibacteria bacterium]|nr:hypothetical protein [Rhodoferax sp.]
MHKLPVTPFGTAPTAMAEKAFATLQAQYALCGQTLSRLPGSKAMYAARWGMVRHLATEEEARLFLARIEGRRHE